MKTKSTEVKKLNKAKGSKADREKRKDGVENSDKIEDLEDDEDYDDQLDSEDNDFIANDDEVFEEEIQAKKRQKRKLKKEHAKTGRPHKDSQEDAVLDDEDLDLIKENRQHKRKLKKTNETILESDEDQIVQKTVKRDEDIAESKYIKREDEKNKAEIKKQNFVHKRDQTTASDDEEKEQVGQNLKDKFITEEIDDVFGTIQDQKIVEEDIPERLQIKLANRFNPTDQELERETEWIFNIIFDTLEQSKEQSFASKIEEVKNKIKKCLILIRREKCDIPYITQVRQNELLPELKPEQTWHIFELDIEFGKFQVQKKQCEEFFDKIKEITDEKSQNIIEHYKNQIFYTNNLRDMNDFQHLINFYKSYYQKELEEIQNNSGKKVPVQKRDMVYISRHQKLDEFSKKCMLHPIQLQENLNEDNQLHNPENPKVGPTELAKEYARKEGEQPLDIIRDMCTYTAIELSSEPDIRRGLKKHIYEYGWIKTQPNDKGKKDLDVFNPTYRTKYVDRKISELNDDLFLEILQNEEKGLINYHIQIRDDSPDEKIGNRYFLKMFEMYRVNDDQSKYRFLRREIFEIISQTQANSRGQKSFLMSIMDEIRVELKEDAEKYVLRQCTGKYREMINTCYFSLDNQRQQQNERREDDIIPQRERPVVMGAIMHLIDNRNYSVTLAVVDINGELVAHKDFLYLMPPRRRGNRDGQPPIMRPGEEDEIRKHDDDRRGFQDILKEQQVDLIVISADCLEAKRLKKALSEFASISNHNEMMQDDNDQDRDMGPRKEAYVIWGRPEIPKLFASSHYSQKLLKNHPFFLKKAICLARWEQDPMNEILNLWSPIMSENQALNIELHPLQKQINQARLLEKMEEVNIQTVNNIGIDINLLIDHEHMHNQLQFLSGLGPRKAQRYIQKLKSLGKPLYTRNEIYENKILQKFCFISSFSQTKVRVPPEKKPQNDFQWNILDQTRIHFRQYTMAYKIACDCVMRDDDQTEVESYAKQQALIEVIKNPNMLKEFAIAEYKEIMKQLDKSNGMNYTFDIIVEDIMHPFRDPRENIDNIRTLATIDAKFSNRELFYYLIDENERTFKEGQIVSATVSRVYESNGEKPARVLCRLENGLDANIGEQDADFFNNNGGQLQIDMGSIVQGRIHQIKFGDGKEGKYDDNFSVILKCKKSDLMRHDNYVDRENMNIPDEDLENIAFKVVEEQTQNQSRALIQKRKIQHQRFQNISSKQAEVSLKQEDVGEFYFRPSSKGIDHLTLTWKFWDENIVHIDIHELDKAIGANIGSKLKIGDEVYDNLQEIVERYIVPCNRLLREVTQHAKFIKCTNYEELKKSVEGEKQQDPQKIPYHFAILPKYPQYVILCYIPKRDIQREFIKVKPRGYFFHHQYHYPFQNMINWYKQNFRDREYQRYLRRAQSPQLGSRIEQKPAAHNPSNVPMDSGMQIDQTGAGWGADTNIKREDQLNRGGYGRGQRRDSSPQRGSGEGGGGWGNTQQSSQIKDERENKAGGWGDQPADNNGWGAASNQVSSPTRPDNGGYGRGRGGEGRGRDRGGGGGDQGGSRACFKCGETGHFARECTNEPLDGGNQSKGRGRGAGGGPVKCYNCQGEGHMARECTEPRKERERGGEPPYKRQRNNDDGGSFRRPNEASEWNANKGQATEGGWGDNQNQNQNQGQNQQPSSQGAAWGDPTPGKNSSAGGGWDNKPSQENNQGGGGGGW